MVRLTRPRIWRSCVSLLFLAFIFVGFLRFHSVELSTKSFELHPRKMQNTDTELTPPCDPGSSQLLLDSVRHKYSKDTKEFTVKLASLTSAYENEVAASQTLRSKLDNASASVTHSLQQVSELRNKLQSVGAAAAHSLQQVAELRVIESQRLRDAEAFPCDCTKCTCGALFVLSTRTPQQPIYKVMYKGSRKPHLRYIATAIQSFKKFNPLMKVAVFTDDPLLLVNLSKYIDYIGEVDTSKQTKPWQEVLVSMTRTPWHKTLYLDADVEICMPLDDLFTVLDHFDIAAVRTRRRSENLLIAIDGGAKQKAAFEAFERHDFYNLFSAVYGYRNTSTSRAIIERARYLDETTDWDHMNNLFHAVEQAKAPSVYILPDEFLFVSRPYEYPAYFTSGVRIFHGSDGATSCARLNTPMLPRLYDPYFDAVVILTPRRTRTNATRWKYWNYWINPAYMSLSRRPILGNESDWPL